jgi:recombination protein RecA
MANAGVDLVILDSVGAGVPKALAEKSVKEVADQGRLGANAAVWSAFLPKLKGRINKTGTTILAISQLRSAVNVMGYGEQFTVQGGKAWRFYSALRMHLKAIGKDKATVYSSLTNKAEDRVVGVKTRARLEKCKVSPQQGNEEIFYIRWGQGIDDLRSLIEIGLAHKLIRKKGAWYYWIDPEGTEHSGQGLEKFRTRFEKDAQNLKALQRQIQPYLASKGGENLDQEIDEDAPEAESFQTDKELEDLLSSISSDEPPADTD